MGLVNLRARTYHPRLGTFTSVDPVLGVGGSTGWNGYLYANANPVNLVDPAGTCVDPLSFIVCAAAAVIGGIYINEWRGNVYANQMEGMSFWEAVSYDHNRPCPTCEVALSFLVPPLGKAFATRDLAYTVATGSPAGRIEAIHQFLLMAAVESRLGQPMMTPGSSGGWTLLPPGGAVTAEFSLPRLDWGRIGFAGGGSTLQPRLAWGAVAIPVSVGGAVSALNAWGSNWIMSSSDDDWEVPSGGRGIVQNPPDRKPTQADIQKVRLRNPSIAEDDVVAILEADGKWFIGRNGRNPRWWNPQTGKWLGYSVIPQANSHAEVDALNALLFDRQASGSTGGTGYLLVDTKPCGYCYGTRYMPGIPRGRKATGLEILDVIWPDGRIRIP